MVSENRHLPQWLRQSAHLLQLILFMPVCKGCENPLVYADEFLLCRECREKIATIRYYDRWLSSCKHCGRPLDHLYDRCGNCILQTPLYRKHQSYSRYQDLLQELILKYKYGGLERLKYLFADFYIELFNEKIHETFDYLIPVPPDKSRKREFVPVLAIAKILARRLRIPLLPDNLMKIKETPPQAELSRAMRLKNLDGAFALKSPEQVKGKKLLVIDDVYTTGTTVNKCTQVLVKHEADVVVMTLARS